MTSAGSGGWRRGALVSLLAGALLALAMPPWGWWPLAFIAFALFSHQVDDPSRRRRAGRGALFALGWFVPAIFWMLDFTLPGYGIAVALWCAFWALAALFCPPGRWRWVGLVGAAVLAEYVRWSWPFGGQPLATVAMTQVDSPLGPTVRVLGPLLLVALVVTVGVALDALFSGSRRIGAGALVGVLAVVLLAGVAPDGHPTGTLDVALVQGGGPQRTRAADTDPRDVFERHLAASEDVDTPVDLVLWPENVINVEGPVETQREGEELSALARELDAPLVVGAVEGDDDRFHNAALVIDADGNFTDRYEKVRRVPFGEYVPLRSFLRPFAGNALPDRDAIEGEGEATVETDVGTFGVVISWEVFFANRARDAISHGGEVLLNPTNGSSYWLTIVQTQQIASSRLRAMETGRWVLQAAPTGLSAIITPDGDVIDRTAVSERAVIQGTIETREGLTLYTRWGDWPMILLALGLVAGSWLAFRRRATGTDTNRRRPDST
ncbi:MAG: apolipoprotein N-acyltransferase [Acidimicrobiales bacterium]